MGIIWCVLVLYEVQSFNTSKVRDERIYGEMGRFRKKIREVRARGR